MEPQLKSTPSLCSSISEDANERKSLEINRLDKKSNIDLGLLAGLEMDMEASLVNSLEASLESNTEITLESILRSESTGPTSLSRFRHFLHRVEHSGENIEFVLWLRDYWIRFYNQPASKIKAKPRNWLEKLAPDSSAHPADLSHFFPNLIVPNHLPFHEDATQAIAAFLAPGARWELNLPGGLRRKIMKELLVNTSPETFLPAYHHAIDLLRTSSLPHFLRQVMPTTSDSNNNRGRSEFSTFFPPTLRSLLRHTAATP